jgi:hypothetical protein
MRTHSDGVRFCIDQSGGVFDSETANLGFDLSEADYEDELTQAFITPVTAPKVGASLSCNTSISFCFHRAI